MPERQTSASADSHPAATADRAVAQSSRPLVERTVLDQAVAESRRSDPRPWGIAVWLGPLLCLVAVVVVLRLLSPVAQPKTGGVPSLTQVALSIGGGSVVLAALAIFGRSVAARGGGWARTLGLDRVRRGDWLPWLLALGIVSAGRIVVAVLANVSTDGRAVAEAGNLQVVHPSPTAVIAFTLAAVILAPVTEELLFRGFLLRAFMRRMPFWPAAGLSTAIFGAFHLHQVDTIVGAVTLAGSISVLGLTACYLVRITGRLTPGVMIHATFNGLALLVALLVGTG
jgi:uncharacterized protein